MGTRNAGITPVRGSRQSKMTRNAGNTPDRGSTLSKMTRNAGISLSRTSTPSKMTRNVGNNPVRASRQQALKFQIKNGWKLIHPSVSIYYFKVLWTEASKISSTASSNVVLNSSSDNSSFRSEASALEKLAISPSFSFSLSFA